MLRVVTFKWKPTAGYRTKFEARHVNVMASMVKRFYPAPHETVCVTDDAEGLHPDIRAIPLWNDFTDLESPHGQGFPSCYRRLRMFSDEAATLIGERFVTIDLDCVISGDLRPLWDRPEDFVILKDPDPRVLYCGAMMLMRAGARTRVWRDFDPIQSPLKARAGRHMGSDQAWISYCLGPNEAMWTRADGLYSFRYDIIPLKGALPADARIINFHGAHNPWDEDVQRQLPWVRDLWR